MELHSQCNMSIYSMHRSTVGLPTVQLFMATRHRNYLTTTVYEQCGS